MPVSAIGKIEKARRAGEHCYMSIRGWSGTYIVVHSFKY